MCNQMWGNPFKHPCDHTFVDSFLCQCVYITSMSRNQLPLLTGRCSIQARVITYTDTVLVSLRLLPSSFQESVFVGYIALISSAHGDQYAWFPKHYEDRSRFSIVAALLQGLDGIGPFWIKLPECSVCKTALIHSPFSIRCRFCRAWNGAEWLSCTEWSGLFNSFFLLSFLGIKKMKLSVTQTNIDCKIPHVIESDAEGSAGVPILGIKPSANDVPANENPHISGWWTLDEPSQSR